MNVYNKTIESRFKAAFLLVLALSGLLLWRLFSIQVFQHEHYLGLALGQQRFEKTEMAQRGRILVHDSTIDPKSYYPLAFDVKKYALWVVPRQVKDKAGLADKLSTLTGLSKDEIYNKINNDKLYIPPIKKGLTLDEGNNIKSQSFSGVFVMPEYSRYYPEGSLASQLLGFVNYGGDGNYGFEGHYNDELKGKSGTTVGEKDTLGRVISLLSQEDPENGNSYVLTIDRSVQYFVEKKLSEAITQYQADSGSVIVMDVKTGGIVAMASSPNYDPNNFKDYAKDNQGIYINPAISNRFEPGSIFKTIMMAAGIDSGTVTKDTEGVFGNYVTIDGYDIHTAENKAFGKETMTNVLENSDNVAMAWLSEKMGKETMYKYAKAFGFSNKTNIDLDGEETGSIPALKNWYNITRATISFGQGISVTPIEMLAAYCAIANNGKYVYPHVVDKIVYPDGTEKQVERQTGDQVISEQTAKTMREMLESVVINGHSKKAAVAGFKVGAKTGTAQIPKAEGGYEINDTGLGIYNHTVEGMAPTDDPKFVMLVKLEKPKTSKYAESTAAPLFGEISSFLLNYYYKLRPTEPIK